MNFFFFSSDEFFNMPVISLEKQLHFVHISVIYLWALKYSGKKLYFIMRLKNVSFKKFALFKKHASEKVRTSFFQCTEQHS